MTGRFMRWSARVFFFLSVCLLLAATGAWAQKHASSVNKLTFLGKKPLTSGVSHGALPPGFLLSRGRDENVSFEIPGVSGNNSPARVRAAGVPTPAGNPIGTGVFFGLPGLTQFDQAVAHTGSANGFNGQTEPPDQGLAVGNGLVVEAINDAIAFYQTNGTLLFSPLAMNVLYGVAPTFTLDAAGNVVSFGPSLGDPRVYYDSIHGFFVVTETETDVDPATGVLGPDSHIFIAVIKNDLSTVSVFSLDVTNDGDAVFGACPCFGDEPLIGADANGFYISTNSFNTADQTFRGAQIYAIPLAALEGGPPGTVVHFGDLTQAGEPAFSIQPATVPPGGSFESGENGTEYLVSTFHNFLDNRLTVWALTNTISLNTASPSLTLVNTVVDSESYGVPPATDQKPGPTPLRDLIASPQSPFGTFKNHLELITDNDDRLQQVVFAAGNLWTAVPTVVKPQGPVRAGAAWFILTPSIGPGQVSGKVLNQGYVAIASAKQNSVMFPAVGANASGKAAISFSVVGEDQFPSAAYALLDPVHGAGPIIISGPGVAPDDGFTGYAPFFTRGTARWGDYSAATSDEFGNLWMGAEWIPQNPPLVLAGNWGTFITAIAP